MESNRVCIICGGFLIYMGVNLYCGNIECRGFQHSPHEPVSQQAGFAGLNNFPTYGSVASASLTGTASISTTTT